MYKPSFSLPITEPTLLHVIILKVVWITLGLNTVAYNQYMVINFATVLKIILVFVLHQGNLKVHVLKCNIWGKKF